MRMSEEGLERKHITVNTTGIPLQLYNQIFTFIYDSMATIYRVSRERKENKFSRPLIRYHR